MTMPIPWGQIGGINFESGGMFNKITVVLVAGDRINNYLKVPSNGVLTDFEYTLYANELSLNEFQLSDVIEKYHKKMPSETQILA